MRNRTFILTSFIILLVSVMMGFNSIQVHAAENMTKQSVAGVTYIFGEKSKYDFATPDSMEPTSEANTYGLFEISGKISNATTKDGIPSYGVDGGNLQFIYTYDDEMLNATGEQEHLIDDKSKTVNDIDLNGDILKGSVVLQTSKDGMIWYTLPNEIETNLFATDDFGKKPFYTTTDTQLMNGCYYRVIIAYKTEKTVGTNKVLFVETDDKECHKYAEVYTFYAYDATAIKVKVPEDNNRMNMGKVVRCTDYDSYGGAKEIDNEDPHSGWAIGSFFVGGYTDSVIDSQTKKTVFLKNNGDRISLWFDLEQNINQCRNNPDIKIVADTKGYDKGFDVPGGVNETMDFGKGVLMIRQKYKDNTYSEPQVYTNFLEAGASPDAITRVELFEEGDYEVALDYAVKYDKTKLFGKTIAPQTNHYRIAFEFEVRNGNTVVFLKDTKTGSELPSGAITENGFYIDLANSQYLKVHVKREVLKDGFDGLSEDIKFNSSATNGDSFTKDGVYTVTVSNQYNNATTEKRVYVGKDNILKAYMVTGLSISEIQDQLELGATIADDGTLISPPEPELEPEVETKDTVEESSKGNSNITDSIEPITKDKDTNTDEDVVENKTTDKKATETGALSQYTIISISVGVVLLIALVLIGKKISSARSKKASDQKEDKMNNADVLNSLSDKEDKEI